MPQLIPPLTAQTIKAFEILPRALARVRPLNAAHKRSLPDDVAALSRLLTTERSALHRPYWSFPAFVSAYMYYFLPWNLLRQARLLSAMPLPEPASVTAAGEGHALLMDAGSGPLTLPIALWLAHPEWDEASVRVLAMDNATQPLELGKTLFSALGELLGRKTWKVRTVRSSVEQLARQGFSKTDTTRPWLVTAANVLNEARGGQRSSRRHDEDISPDGHLEQLFDSFAAVRPHTPPALLFIEPGTRLGGKTIMQLRDIALQNGFFATSPCTHSRHCPLLAGDGGKTWCHFTFDAQGAPPWLTRLSRDAGLTKTALSLSPLLLRPTATSQNLQEGMADARVISAPFHVPGLTGLARYACSAEGLLLIEDAEAVPGGDMLRVPVNKNMPLDKKSRAKIVHSRPSVIKTR